MKNILPISRTGLSAIWAFFTAVTVLVSPGPAVTAATPTVPDMRATASAAKTVETCNGKASKYKNNFPMYHIHKVNDKNFTLTFPKYLLHYL